MQRDSRHSRARRTGRTPILFAVSLLCLPLTAGAGIDDFFSDLNLVSTGQEEELSARVAAEVESKQPIIEDRRVRSYLSELGNRLVRQLDDPVFRYRFEVVDDASVNAFNIGGGRIYVHRGLIVHSRTEGELASVLAHEIGHQVERHVAKAITRQQAFQTLASFVVGADANQWVQLAAGLGITTGQLHFSRDAEREADGTMVNLLLRSGYDPREAVRMLTRIQQQQRGGGAAVASFFSSHPATGERIERVKRKIDRLRLRGDLRRDSKRFHEIQRLLAAR